MNKSCCILCCTTRERCFLNKDARGAVVVLLLPHDDKILNFEDKILNFEDEL